MTDEKCFEGGPGEHDCRKVVLDLLGEYEAGTLAASERAALEKHIAMCPPCVSFLSTYRATGKCLKSLKPSDVPDALAESILAFVRAQRDSSR
jgi:anti-sigma factor ChrR (cupin superfamily)